MRTKKIGKIFAKFERKRVEKYFEKNGNILMLVKQHLEKNNDQKK